MARIVLAGALAAAALAASLPAMAQQAQNPMPPGEGRDIVAVACTQCHAPSAFAQLREGPDAWRSQVYDMILRGAQVGPDDIDKVVGYLSASYGPGVNVPEGRAATLPDGPGKDLVASHCAVCHGLDRITETKRTSREWDGILARMVFLGAPVSGDDAKIIKGYLDSQAAK